MKFYGREGWGVQSSGHMGTTCVFLVENEEQVFGHLLDKPYVSPTVFGM